MGAQHSRPAEPGAIPGSSYAHIDKTPAACTAPWMTIMGNECEVCSTSDPEDCTVCTQAPYWSNPDSDVSFCGEVVGSDDDNNRDTLNLTALTVANFRCGAPTADDVWMKDAWEDTGSEPDSNLATEPVWKSPYVWVRNAPDTSVNFEKQHQHQNPITGQTNYIYIKVHNGGVATSGTLQVLAADAATGLSWPTSFTQVGSADIVFLPKSTRIVELPWAPTESGHFSLIARWSSVSDAIAVPEGPSIDTNVRSNNNIVWRNVNIVDLGPATDSSSATFIVRNLVDTQARMSLKLKPSDRYPGHSFFSAGSVSVHLSDQVFAAWRKGAFDGNGFTRDGQDLQIVDANGATLEGLVFEAGSEGEIVITFSRQNDSDVVPRGMFLIDVIQSTLKQTEVAVDGGITYEIHSQ
jgi:hypothetical protein